MTTFNTFSQEHNRGHTPLYQEVQTAVENYLSHLNGERPTNMYEIFLSEFEKPLLIHIMKHTRNNQSKAAQMLGLNRGTLRTKLKTHGLL
ncbi:MAG: DNA-binding transcriptional regulator Fis [Moraxella sp.]|uniref:DNA-binding transcriptional regulator Fis n=1 Tax=Moraxella sp. TaxID=479 RepID=UPI0026DD1110|nr:DNA-binding transcriptional regulator Fis [Moraxella sp.]MDO4449476.1 DNA-binding transcriptional regulator Fis [Moraxella sp.]